MMTKNNYVKRGLDMIVYHYCSLDVFMKIVSGKAIRLSDITKSNDSMEILWITKFIKDIFDDEFQKEIQKTQYFENGYPKETFIELVEHYSDEFFKENIRLYSYLVCCFSEKGDLLSQWRGYADDANGVSIGFDGNFLSTIGKPAKDDFISSDIFEFGQIIYTDKSQQSEIRKIAQQLIAKLKVIVKNNPKDIKHESMAVFNDCFLQLFKLSIFIKNPFFKEEKEWRICYWTDIKPDTEVSNTYIENNIKISDIKYHNRRNDLIPHIDLIFDESKEQIIKEVIIGPKCKASKSDIEAFLAKNGIFCSVKKSDGTYR